MKNCLGHVGCIAHGIHLLLTTDISKGDAADKVNEVLRKVKQAHGKLAYKNPELKKLHQEGECERIKEYLRQWEEELTEVMDASENIFYTSDYDDFLNERNLQEQLAKANVEHFHSFKKPNVTRWMSSFVMLKSYQANQGEIL